MRYFFKFPDIGEGITEGKILQWHVEKGNRISEGEPVVNMETDKVVTDIPSPKSGVIVSRYGQPGDVINVGDALLEIEIEGVQGEEAVKTAAEGPSPQSKSPAADEKFGVVGSLEVAGDGAFLPASSEGQKKTESPPPGRKKVLATPVARAKARDLNIDIQSVPGTGPGGRVMKEDIRKFSLQGQNEHPVSGPGPEENGGPEILEISQVRKAIARNMALSKHSIPEMTVFEEVEVSRLSDVRRKLKAEAESEGIKLTYLAFIVKAVSRSLRRHPLINGRFDAENEQILSNREIHIGIAVDTPEGLVVPVVRNADDKPILEMAGEIQYLADKAVSRTLELDEMKGGTFTITNYGSIGGIHAVPIINYPQSGILGVGRILDKPVVKNGEVIPGKVLPLSLTVDHRIVDGGEAARFVNRIRDFLAEPASLAVF